MRSASLTPSIRPGTPRDAAQSPAFCWNWVVDPVCVELCQGSAANPLCTEPCGGCVIADYDNLAFCIPVCDPLAQDCGEGRACYPIVDTFACEVPGTICTPFSGPGQPIDTCITTGTVGACMLPQ